MTTASCLRLNSFRLLLKNDGGTIKHAFSPLNYVQITYPSPLDPDLMPSVNKPADDFTTTPTGSFAGGLALLGGDSSVRLDTQDLGANDCRLIVNCVGSSIGIALNAACFVYEETINGVTQSRPLISLNRADNNDQVAINTTNIPAGKFVTIDALGWIK